MVNIETETGAEGGRQQEVSPIPEVPTRLCDSRRAHSSVCPPVVPRSGHRLEEGTQSSQAALEVFRDSHRQRNPEQ